MTIKTSFCFLDCKQIRLTALSCHHKPNQKKLIKVPNQDLKYVYQREQVFCNARHQGNSCKHHRLSFKIKANNRIYSKLVSALPGIRYDDGHTTYQLIVGHSNRIYRL